MKRVMIIMMAILMMVAPMSAQRKNDYKRETVVVKVEKRKQSAFQHDKRGGKKTKTVEVVEVERTDKKHDRPMTQFGNGQRRDGTPIF